jgi:UDP-glucose 4-epimerase
MKILITGGTGYLANALATQLIGTSHQVLMASRHPENGLLASKNIKYIQIAYEKLNSESEFLSEVDLVVHCAGLSAQESIKDPKKASQVNGKYTESIVKSAKAHGVKRFVYISTAHVYRDPLIGVIDENSLLENNHPYATSHVEGEKAVASHQGDFIYGAMCFRLSNTFGLPIFANSAGWNLVINEWCRTAIRENSIKVHSSLNVSRNFIPVQDAARELLSYSTNFQWLPENFAINIGDAKSRSLIEIVSVIKDQVQEIFEINLHVRESMDQQEIQTLEFKSVYKEMQQYDFENAIKELLLFCKSQLNQELKHGS